MKRPTIPEDRREHAALIVAHFSTLVHAWQTSQFNEAAEAQAALDRMGVKVSIPKRRVIVQSIRADDDSVDVASIDAGIVLVEWFKNETRRVYGLLSENNEDRDRRRLVEWIEAKGGSVTGRDVQQAHRRFSTAEEAEAALKDLVQEGLGRWKIDDHAGGRGRPASRFVLASTSTQMPESPRNENCVDVDRVDSPKNDEREVFTI